MEDEGKVPFKLLFHCLHRETILEIKFEINKFGVQLL